MQYNDDNDDDREALTQQPPKKAPKKTINDVTDDGDNTLIGDLQNEKRNKILKWGLIGGAILLVVILAIVLPIVLSKKNP